MSSTSTVVFVVPPSAASVVRTIVFSLTESTVPRKPPNGLRGSPALSTAAGLLALTATRRADHYRICCDGAAFCTTCRPDGDTLSMSRVAWNLGDDPR